MEINIQENFKKYKVIDIKNIILANWNYKETDNDSAISLIEKLKSNLKRNGQVENIQVRLLNDGKYEVINGNHRVMAFLQLKIKKIISYDHGKISLNEAKRIAIETNETKFKADNMKLADIIVEIQDDFTIEELVQTMPFSNSELKNFSKLSEFSWDQYDQPDNIDTGENKKEEFGTIKYPLLLQPDIDKAKNLIGTTDNLEMLQRLLDNYIENNEVQK